MSISKPKSRPLSPPVSRDYPGLLGGISQLLEAARRASVRSVNAFMTATYWEVGRRIVEFEQGGEKRAGCGEELLRRLADDLTTQFGRGFSRQNLQRFRLCYLSQLAVKICPTLSGISRTPSGKSLPLALADLTRAFPLPWAHYVLLISRSRHAPFSQHGGLGKAHQLFGAELPSLLNELNDVLAA